MSILIDETAVRRIAELRTQQEKPSLMLRVTVEGGGCSGFQYNMILTEEKNAQDFCFDDVVVTDDVSLNFLKDSVVRFKSDLIGAAFVIDNPNAVSGCGCGTSFSV